MIEATRGGFTDANLIPVPLSIAYFPGVPDIASAQPVELQPGAELEGVNIVLSPKPPTYRIRGRILDSRNGQPPPFANVFAVMDSNGVASNSIVDQISRELPLNSYNAATGQFEVKDLSAGNYTVNATAQVQGPVVNASSPAGRGSTALSGSVKVAIPNADVEGIAIAVNPPITITGKVRVDGNLPIMMDRLRFQLTSRNPAAGPGSQYPGTISAAADGTITFPNVPLGEFRVFFLSQGAVPLSAGARPGSNALFIKEARYDGMDVLNGTLRVNPSVTSLLEIVIGVGGGQLSGVLTDRRGQPVPVSQVVLVPDRVRDRTELYRTSITSDAGRFQFIGIIPGDYKVYSWEGVEPYGWFDPEFMRQSETKGTAVHVTDSSTDMIEVRLIPKEGAQ